MESCCPEEPLLFPSANHVGGYPAHLEACLALAVDAVVIRTNSRSALQAHLKTPSHNANCEVRWSGTRIENCVSSPNVCSNVCCTRLYDAVRGHMGRHSASVHQKLLMDMLHKATALWALALVGAIKNRKPRER